MGASYYDLDFDYDRRHQLKTVKEAGGRFDAGYQFTAAGKLSYTKISTPGPPGPGSDVIAREVNYAFADATNPEAVTALVNVNGGASFRSYAYDSAGNMETRSDGTTNDAFLYDGEDQLRRASVTTGSVTTKEEYFYDYSGQRTAVVTRNAGGTVVTVRVFMGDSEILLTPGATTKTYAHLALGTPVARVTNRADIEFQYQGLSSNTLLSVKPDGSTKSGFVYGPYGELLETTGNDLAEQHRRFNDKFRDDATKLSYYGVRYYDGVLLGWTQGDPLFRFAPDAAWDAPRLANLYQFTLSNPVRYLDPDGRQPAPVALAPLGAPAIAANAAIVATGVVASAGIVAVAIVEIFTSDDGGGSGMKPADTWADPEMTKVGELLAAGVGAQGILGVLMATKVPPKDATAATTASTTTTATPPPPCYAPDIQREIDADDGDAPRPRGPHAKQRMSESATVAERVDRADSIQRAQAAARKKGVGAATINKIDKTLQNLKSHLPKCQEEADGDDKID